MQSVIRRLQRGNSIEIPAATPPYLPGKSVSPRCSLLDKGDGREKKKVLSSSSLETRNESPTSTSQCIATLTPETAARSDPPFVRASGSLASVAVRWIKIFRINPVATLCTSEMVESMGRLSMPASFTLVAIFAILSIFYLPHIQHRSDQNGQPARGFA